MQVGYGWRLECCPQVSTRAVRCGAYGWWKSSSGNQGGARANGGRRLARGGSGSGSGTGTGRLGLVRSQRKPSGAVQCSALQYGTITVLLQWVRHGRISTLSARLFPATQHDDATEAGWSRRGRRLGWLGLGRTRTKRRSHDVRAGNEVIDRSQRNAAQRNVG